MSIDVLAPPCPKSVIVSTPDEVEFGSGLSPIIANAFEAILK